MSAGKKWILGLVCLPLGLVTYWVLSDMFMPVRYSGGPDYWTYCHLHYIIFVTTDFYTYEADEKEKESIRNLRTPEELYSLLHAKRNTKGRPIVPTDEKYNFEGDAWFRPFMLKVQVRGRDTCLKIISSGPNGKFENGNGDDFFLEMVFDGKRVIRAIIRFGPKGIIDLMQWWWEEEKAPILPC